MPSLTPSHRSDEVSASAFAEGAYAGLLALVPSSGAVYVAMKTSPRFVKATNWQSRTALAIMPALFAFGFASENHLIHRMHEVADETEHAKALSEWHDEQVKEELIKTSSSLQREMELEAQLTKLYRQSVEDSGVRIVPGELRTYQKALNYFNDNPVKVLAAVGVPTIGYILYGRAGQEHLTASMKLMHTRVMGQAATITILLSLMGFKEYMIRNGKYMTEEEAEQRVNEMKRVRQDLLMRMEAEKQAVEAQQEEIRKAHEADVREGHVHHHPKKHHHKKKQEEPLPTKLDTVVATSSAQ